MTKRIGILTSGGDCGGLNAAIRAVALRAHHGYGWTTVGLRSGTLGLLERPVEAVELDPARLDAALARQGGTFLGSTNRGDPFAFPILIFKKDRSGEMISASRGSRSMAVGIASTAASTSFSPAYPTSSLHGFLRPSTRRANRTCHWLFDGGRHSHRGARRCSDGPRPRVICDGGDGPRCGHIATLRHRPTALTLL